MPYVSEKAHQEILEHINKTWLKLEKPIQDKMKGLYPTFCAMSDYLGTGSGNIQPALLKLEENLKQKINSQIDQAVEYFKNYTTRAASFDKPPSSPYSKLLTGHMAQLEEVNGFNSKIYTIYLGRIDAQTFQNEREKARHFKDLISPQHGEYTHRIQWYLMMSAGIISDNGGKSIFQSVLAIPGLWDILLDRLPADDPFEWDPDDMRRPENLNAYLTSQLFIQQCPIIGNYLVARMAKRQNTMSTMDQSQWRNSYIARKLYRKSYESCLQTEKEKVDLVAKRLIIDPEIDTFA